MSPNAEAPQPDESRAETGLPATVIANLPNRMFSLRLPNGRLVTAHAAQNTRMAFVRLVEGDVVRIEISPFDSQRARILALVGDHHNREQQPPAQRNNPFPPTQREQP